METADRPGQAQVVDGARFQQAGDLDAAARCYEAALSLDPADHDARCLLGLVRQQQGRVAEAIDLFEHAVATRPDVPRYLAGLGVTYQAAGRHADAAGAFARLAELYLGLGQPGEAFPHAHAAVALQSDLVTARLALADAWMASGRLAEAHDTYQQAARLDPRSARAAAGVGIAAIRLHRRDAGLAWLRRAVELEPDSMEFLRHLGEAASSFGLREEVQRCCDRILALDPRNAPARNTLGSIAYRDGRRDEARAHYLHAIELEPRLANAHFNLGVLHEETGEKDEADVCYRMAIQCDPTQATALARLASMRRGHLPDADVQAIHRLLGNPGLPPGMRQKLLFAMADVHDGRGEFPQAAAWLEQANAQGRERLRLRGESYNPDEHHRFIDAIIDTFTPALFARLAGAGLDTRRPVFIVGMPRSGTTLIEQILASHPDVHGAGEITLVRQSLDDVLEVTGHPGPRLDAVKALRPGQVAGLARRHDQRLAAIDGGRAGRIVNKRPENYFYLGLIALMFPRSVVIHCRRDPRDVALSCWAADFAEVRWAYQPDHIASRFTEYRRLMGYWRTVLPGGLTVHDVAYEETVDDLERVARRLTDALGLDWHPACLDFHQTRRPVQSASQDQVRRPLYRTSVGRWKHYAAELGGLFAMVEEPGLVGPTGD